MNGQGQDGFGLYLAGYSKIAEHGFALPCFAQAQSENTWYLADCVPPGDHTGRIAAFRPFDPPDLCRLTPQHSRLMCIGDPWCDVFLWHNKAYVGTPQELWAALASDLVEMTLSAPLSTLDLADAVEAADGGSIATTAFSYLRSNFDLSRAERWRDETYLRGHLLREIRSILGFKSFETSYRRLLQEVAVELSTNGTLYLEIPQQLAHELGGSGTIENLFPRLRGVAQAFGAITLKLKDGPEVPSFANVIVEAKKESAPTPQDGGVLFVKTSTLGDIVHFMPALTEARRHLPRTHFAWVVEEVFLPLVRLHPAVDEAITLASRRWRTAPFLPSTWSEVGGFRRRAGERQYDIVIDAQGLLRSALIARFGRGVRHGYDRESIRERAASWFYDIHHRVDRGLHTITRNRMLVAQVLGYEPAGAPDYGLNRAVISGHRPKENRVVLLHSTARPEKEWPVDNWKELAVALADLGFELLIPWGSTSERERSRLIASTIEHATILEPLPLDRVARQIASASIVVGVDTGLAHLAAALGVPLVMIVAQPSLSMPLGSGPIEIIESDEIAKVDDVVSAVTRLMA